MRFILLAAAGSLLPCTTACPEGLALPALTGYSAAYEGILEIKQSIGDDASNTGKFRSTLVIRVSEPTPGKPEVIAVRFLKPTDEGAEPVVGFDEGTLALRADGWRIEWKGETPPELEEGIATLEGLYPLTVLPEFTAPEGQPGTRSDVEIRVLGAAAVKASVVASLQRQGDSLTLTRNLAPGSTPAFKLRDESSTLVGWSERFQFDSPRGLPSRIERTLAFEGKVADTKSTFELKLGLDRKRMSDGSGDQGARLAQVEKELRSVGQDFAALGAPEEISKRVAAARESLKGTVLELAGEALQRRLEVYKASGLGKLAPDFTLESLDGKKVSFREATRGKVVLLSFWGVG